MASKVSIRLGKRIRSQRLAKGWRQIDLAQHSGIREVHLSYLERGLREVGLNTLVAIANALDITLSELFRDIE